MKKFQPIKNLLAHFTYPSVLERMCSDYYEMGKITGIEEGKILEREAKILNSAELSKEEYDELIKFLVDRNLELCYSVHSLNGFEVRKRKYEH